jgi:hypothetical protein
MIPPLKKEKKIWGENMVDFIKDHRRLLSIILYISITDKRNHQAGCNRLTPHLGPPPGGGGKIGTDPLT